jgi:hypothetical protein
MTVWDVLAYLVDNSSIGGDGKYKLNAAIEALADEAGAAPPTVNPSGPPVVVVPLAIATTTLPNGTPGVAYSSGFTASGGTGPFTWTIAGLPAGLTANAAGLVTGSPETAGDYSVTAIVTDSSAPALTAAVTLSLVVA